MPKSSEEQKMARAEAIQAATKHAIDIPMQVAEVAFKAMDVAESMRVDPTGFSPQLSREDGSFTNW